jgi:uncharacterized membrane protein YiaA
VTGEEIETKLKEIDREFSAFRGQCDSVGVMVWCLSLLFLTTGAIVFGIGLWSHDSQLNAPAMMMVLLSLTQTVLAQALRIKGRSGPENAIAKRDGGRT